MNRKNEALIIIDMSNDFVGINGGLTAGQPARDIVPYITELANEFITNEGTVVVTMDAHQENDPHFELWPPHNVIGTDGQKLYGLLDQWYEANFGNENLLYVPKTNYNAFFGTGLADTLKERGITTVHLVGVATDICVFLTAAGADAEGFKTIAHKRGAATFTNKHEMFLDHMKLCFFSEIVE